MKIKNIKTDSASESFKTGNPVEVVACAFQKLEQSASSQMNAEEDGWRIAFNTKYLMDFFSIHAAKRDEQRIIWKFAGQAQTEMAFEGKGKLFSYILVPLKS